MIKLIFLAIFFLMGNYALRADETPGASDQDFKAELDNIKNPFEDGVPKPVIIQKLIPQTVYKMPIIVTPKIEAIVGEVSLPALVLQGVIVGEGIHQAIINDTIVPLRGTIQGARVIAVSKRGVELLFKGKKFFLKVE